MEKFLQNIQIKENEYAGLGEFEWKPNEGLNIITGLNGSGKTRLLHYICEKFRFREKQKLKDIISEAEDYYYDDNKTLFVLKGGEYVEIKKTFEYKFIENANKYKGFNTLNQLYQYINRYKISILIGDRAEAKALIKVCEARKYFEENDNNSWERYKKSKGFEENPWDTINSILKDFKLEVRFQLEISKNEKEISLENYWLKEALKEDVMIRFIKNNRKYKSSELSNGEKIAYRLALWYLSLGLQTECKTLLLDEPDAYLNPSLIKIL